MTSLTGRQKRASKRAENTQQVKDFLNSIKMDDSNMETVRQVLRAKSKEDFWFFQLHVYGNIDTATPLHQDMCNMWQRRINKRFTIQLIPRSHLKTSCWTEAGTLWELIRDPHLRFLIVNAKLENAIAIVANIKSCVSNNEIFRWLFPEYCPDLAPASLRRKCKWLNDRLDFPCSKYAGRKEGNIEVMGVEASLVSKHYDRLVFDDPVNDVNTTSKTYRDKIQSWFKNALQLRHDANSKIRLIGTRWHFDDLYSRIIKAELARREILKKNGKKVTPRYWIYHRQVVEEVEHGGEEIVGYENVQPIWPERYNKDSIEEIRSENGSYIFSCQYMNNPLPEEDAVFKYTDINIVDEYEIPENVVNFIACDTAVDDVEDGDWWVITCASFDSEGRMFVREIIRDKLLTSSFLSHIKTMVRKWNPVRVGIETVAFQKTIYKVYKGIAAQENINVPWCELRRGKSSKRKRILGFQPRVERGDFYIEENIENLDWAVEELTTYPRSTNDDILDTLADIEAMFFKAPEVLEEARTKDTFEDIYGSIENLEDEYIEDDSDYMCLNEVA